jgi:hypothetical protein
MNKKIDKKDVIKFDNNYFETNDFGGKYITSIEKRYQKSKFAKMIIKMTDKQIQALGYCLLIDKQVKNAIDCYSQAVDNTIQLYALKKEYEMRQGGHL